MVRMGVDVKGEEEAGGGGATAFRFLGAQDSLWQWRMSFLTTGTEAANHGATLCRRLLSLTTYVPPAEVRGREMDWANCSKAQ